MVIGFLIQFQDSGDSPGVPPWSLDPTDPAASAPGKPKAKNGGAAAGKEDSAEGAWQVLENVHLGPDGSLAGVVRLLRDEEAGADAKNSYQIWIITKPTKKVKLRRGEMKEENWHELSDKTGLDCKLSYTCILYIFLFFPS